MKRMIQIVSILISVLFAGCNSTYYGGAPEPSFDVDKDLKQLAAHFDDTNSIADYYQLKKDPKTTINQLKAARDKFIAGRLTMMNIRYIQFIRQMTSDKQLLDSSVEILGIGLNIAGVLFDSAATKTALAGVAAGVTGSKATIDKNYYFERTIPALIAAMNAQRKAAFIPILTGIQKDVNEYPFEQAVTDLHSYYFAGTFIGAIQAIQTDAGVKERETDKDIVKVLERIKATPEQKDMFRQCTEAIGRLTENDLKKAVEALKSLEPEGTLGPTNIENARKRLQDQVIKRNAEEVYKEFEKAKIIP
ncbi:MAG: hypothetical protein A2167_05230 [Planctomycetes bacterium RBG_13_46_10]|nr:MAG: hypothetical protein A2167_05230 [Planctomycetes bacterium RBG_13_46_10]